MWNVYEDFQGIIISFMLDFELAGGFFEISICPINFLASQCPIVDIERVNEAFHVESFQPIYCSEKTAITSFSLMPNKLGIPTVQ